MSNIIGAGQEIVKDYNSVYLHEDDDARIAKLEMWIAKQIGEHLVRVYPRRRWEIQVNIPGRFLIVVCPSLDNVHGYHIHMKQDDILELQKKAENAAGEILERFGLTRGKEFNPDHMETFDRDLRDNVIPIDDSMRGENPLKGK